MRKYLLLFILFTFLLPNLDAQPPTLSFRVVNPQIYLNSSTNYLKFTLQVKANQAGTYFYSGQVNLFYSISAFGTTVTGGYASSIRSGISAGMNMNDDFKYNIQTNLNSDVLNVFVNTTKFNYPAGGGSLNDWFNQITDQYQDFAIVKIQILDATQEAGMYFNQPVMNGQESYQNTSSPYGYLIYSDPNVYDETKNFQHLNLQRIFSAPAGWTQYGGNVNLGVPVNTSVWDSTATIDGIALTNKFRIHKTAQFIINPDAKMNCYDSVDIGNSRGLWIKSNPTSTGSFINSGVLSCSDSGSALIDRFLSQDKWHGYCVPVSNTNTHPFVDIQLLAKWYDEPEHKYHSIVNPAGDSILNRQMLGYNVYSNSALLSNSTISVSGTPNSGAIVIPVSATMSADGPDGWNLIGNPYPSGVFWTLMTLSDVDPVMYIFDPLRGNYIFWNSNDITHTTNISSVIPAMQGFYVHCHASVPGTGSVAVDNGARTHDNYSYYKNIESDDNLLILSAYGNGFRDEAQIWFNDESTLSFDWEHDVYKRWGNELAPQLYSELPDSNLAALDVLPWAGSNMVVSMGYKSGISGTDTIIARNIQSFDNSLPIWIKDLQENRLQELTLDSVYIFTATPSDPSDRFRIFFRDPATGIQGTTPFGIEVFSFNNCICVKKDPGFHLRGDLVLFDMAGMQVFASQVNDTELNRFYPDVTEGCYVVKVISDSTMITQKVFLK
jgi:hypothetical protein